MTLLSIEALTLPAKLDDDCMGFRAFPKMPSAVELGFMLRGSETDRKDGSRLGNSSGLSTAGASRGVLASEESSEPGEAGVLGS